MNHTTNSTEEAAEYLQTFGSRIFWITFLCLFSFVALCGFYFYFYHLVRQYRTLLLKKINHHVLLCLLITDYLIVQTELPLTIGFMVRNQAIFNTYASCVLWNYWFYVWSTMSIQFSMFTAINRYLLVFHKVLLMKHKVLLHYLPIACICLYLPCIHLYFIVFFPYGNTTFNMSKVWCGGPSFLYHRFFITWDTLFHTFAPVVMLIVFNVIIIVRVTFSKKVSTSHKWQKHRRLILQLFTICISQLVGCMPYCVVTLGVIYESPTFAQQSYTQAFIYVFYIPSLLSPFFAIITLPKDNRNQLIMLAQCYRKKRAESESTNGIH